MTTTTTLDHLRARESELVALIAGRRADADDVRRLDDVRTGIADATHETHALRIYSRDYDSIGDGELIYSDDDGPDSTLVECEPDEWDRSDDIGPVELAARVLDDAPVSIYPDCSHGAPSWFSGWGDDPYDYSRDGGIEWSAHFVGPWTDDERARVWRTYNAR